MTGTYEIQDINITSDCLSVTQIKNSTISTVYLLLESLEGQKFRGNASLSQAVCFFIAQNRSTYNISSFAQGNGNWTLQAYDRDEEDEEPAYKLRNITIDHRLVKDGKPFNEPQASSSTSKLRKHCQPFQFPSFI